MARDRRLARAAGPATDLSAAERTTLLETALDLLETLYVHLPLKRAMYAVNPLQRLKLLRRRIDPSLPALGDGEFFNELLSIFCQLRDLHTSFVLPEPFQSSTAWLPFRLEKYHDELGTARFVVSEVMADAIKDPAFRVGAVVTHWNGTPIRRVVAANAEREAGSNPAAQLARGLEALTIRWLGQSLLPDEDWVDVCYLIASEAKAKTLRFKWRVLKREAEAGAAAIARARGANLRAVGMDARGESERLVRRYLFKETRRPGRTRRGDRPAAPGLESVDDVFSTCADVQTAAGVFAYVRLATFNVAEEQPYLDEFARIVGGLSQDGLILDVRGNGGGLITFGERLLQLLTPRPIEPARFSFLNSARTQRLTEQHAFIRPWRESVAQWIETGAEYSQGFPLLPAERYNDIGQKYQGPVVLVTDALCYSTTDIFAAGFQDHRVGVILGADESTGAGGANVWDYSLIAELLDDARRFPRVLPRAASFRFAVRRVTRVGPNAGVLLEDLGVRPDERHRMTRRDVLEGNRDLIEHAARILAVRPRQRLTAKVLESGQVRFSYQNLDRIDVYLEGRPLRESLEVKRSNRLRSAQISVPKRRVRPTRRELRLEGWRLGAGGRAELVASTRIAV